MQQPGQMQGQQPMSPAGGAMSGQVAEAPRRPHLYVGNLSPRVTEYMLTEIFAVAGPVQSVKIIPDRNFQHGGLNYGFVEYVEMRAAETALQTLNGRKIFDTEIRVNWAYQGQQQKEDISGHYHVFVGDLSPEVNDEALNKAFGAFGSLSDARVMWDMNSGKSRGYGFLAFREKADAEQAIATMNGEWLGSRAIRVNWANQKTQGAPGGMRSAGAGPTGPSSAGAGGAFGSGPVSYESVVAQTPPFNTTVYVGNLIPYTTQADLIPLFQGFGYIVEIRMQADRGFAFVKLDTHENAAMAIVQLSGQLVHGRPVKCSWGKDRNAEAGGMRGGMAQPGAQFGNMMYGMPNQFAYGGFQGGYGGFPQQGLGAAGGTGAGIGAGGISSMGGAGVPGQMGADAAGMQMAALQGMGGMAGMGGANGAAAGQDPSQFYQNYAYGGYNNGFSPAQAGADGAQGQQAGQGQQ